MMCAFCQFPSFLGNFFCLFVVSALASFEIKSETWNNTNGETAIFKRLINTDTNESALISTHPIGRIEELFLHSQQHNDVVDMLVGHNKNVTALLNDAHYKSNPLMPWANRIANATYNFFGEKYIVPVNEPARNDALHGFVCKYNASIIYTNISNNNASVTVGIEFLQSLNNLYQGYPFEFKVLLTFILNSNGLTVNTQIFTYESSHAMPFYMGYHPYFKVSNVSETSIKIDTGSGKCGNGNNSDKYIELLTKGDLESGPLIPTGESILTSYWNGTNVIGVNKSNNNFPNYYDNGYRSQCGVFDSGSGSGKEIMLEHEIRDGVNNVTKVLWQDSNFRFNQLYTGLKQATGEDGVAFEPQSGSTNGFNNGDHLTVLYPGQSFVANFGFKVL